MVQRTHDTERSTIHHMRVDHCGAQILVAQKRLNRSDVRACLEQVRCEAVAKRVTGDALVDPSSTSRFLDRLLNDRLVQMIEDGPAGRWIGARSRSRKQILPCQSARRLRHFNAQRVWQVDLPATGGQFLLVAVRHVVELGPEALPRSCWKDCRAVVGSFPSAHHDLAALQVIVFYADRQTFEEAQAASIEELADQATRRAQVIEHRKRFLPRQHSREVIGAACALEAIEVGHGNLEDTPVEKDHGAEDLILRGCRRSTFHREVVEEGGDLSSPHLSRVTASMEGYELPDSMHIRLLRARRVVQASDARTEPVDQRHGEDPWVARSGDSLGCPRVIDATKARVAHPARLSLHGPRETLPTPFPRCVALPMEYWGTSSTGSRRCPVLSGGERTCGLATGIRSYAATA